MKERKNPNPERKERTVVERGYFDTGNSGITISMVEEVQNYDWDREDRNWYNHYLEVRHGAFGASTSIRTPIAGPTMCDYYIEAFTRFRDRMLADPKYQIPSTFRNYPHEGVLRQREKAARGNNHRIVDIANGLKREEIWSTEIITGPSSTSRSLLGFKYTDAEGLIVRFESYNDDHDIGSCGSEILYDESDIGKPVSLVKQRKVALMADEVGAEVTLPEEDTSLLEQVACIVARQHQVGLMLGPVSQSVFTGGIIEAKSRKFNPNGPITSETIGQSILDEHEGQDVNIHVYQCNEIVIKAGYRMDPQTFEASTVWSPEERWVVIRYGVEPASPVALP